MPIPATPYIWSNGKLIPWEKATVHVLSHALHYGSSVFEGVRAYETPKGVAIFRLKDHTKRLFDSAKIYRIPMPFDETQINDACRTVGGIGEDGNLPALPGACVHADVLERNRQEPGRHLLAGGDNGVVFAGVVEN